MPALSTAAAVKVTVAVLPLLAGIAWTLFTCRSGVSRTRPWARVLVVSWILVSLLIGLLFDTQRFHADAITLMWGTFVVTLPAIYFVEMHRLVSERERAEAAAELSIAPAMFGRLVDDVLHVHEVTTDEAVTYVKGTEWPPHLQMELLGVRAQRGQYWNTFDADAWAAQQGLQSGPQSQASPVAEPGTSSATAAAAD